MLKKWSCKNKKIYTFKNNSFENLAGHRKQRSLDGKI